VNVARIVRFPGQAWADQLHYTDSGLRHKSVGNAMLMLENLPDMQDVFRYNLFTKEVEITRGLPWSDKVDRAITESDMTHVIRWLEDQGQFGINQQLAFSAVQAVAERSSYHPLQEWLTSLAWDKQPRIDNWLSYYLGCEANDYTRAVGAKFLVGCVARAMRPGCKFDNMLILEGPQGILKSTSLAILFGKDYFTDEIADFGSKDAAMQLQGVWCVEVAELSTFTRSAAERTKEFVSRRVDRIRPPYGRLLVKWPRTAVLVGTTNVTSGYFQDHTGNRRFWPILCAAIDGDALKADRGQLWAEAYARYAGGAQWWLEGDEIALAVAEQDSRYDEDAWHQLIADFIVGRTSVTTHEILTTCLNVQVSQINDPMKKRVARTLASIGWKATVAKDASRKSQKVWKPEERNTLL
jgi:predicted P-loop ATPase